MLAWGRPWGRQKTNKQLVQSFDMNLVARRFQRHPFKPCISLFWVGAFLFERNQVGPNKIILTKLGSKPSSKFSTWMIFTCIFFVFCIYVSICVHIYMCVCLFVLKGFPNQIHVYLSIETYKNHKCIYIYILEMGSGGELPLRYDPNFHEKMKLGWTTTNLYMTIEVCNFMDISFQIQVGVLHMVMCRLTVSFLASHQPSDRWLTCSKPNIFHSKLSQYPREFHITMNMWVFSIFAKGIDPRAPTVFPGSPTWRNNQPLSPTSWGISSGPGGIAIGLPVVSEWMRPEIRPWIRLFRMN